MTLIDIAVFMMVGGLIAVPMIKAYDIWRIQKAIGETQDHQAAIDKAIADFYFENGRYPCPSNITLARTSANYGKEDPVKCAVAPVAGNVLHGGVPFVDLKIPEFDSLDGWNNRIHYAVSDEMRAAPFNAAGGAITVKGNALQTNPLPPFNQQCNYSGNNVYTTAGHYVLVSYGASGAGARTVDGGVVQACPAAGATEDAENCIDDANFFPSVCAASDIPGANFYDDIFSYKSTAPSRIWVYTAPNPNDILTMIPKVGINNPNPFANPGDPGGGIDVMGNILTYNNVAGTGNTDADTMCDGAGTNCFGPADIGGVRPTLNCRSAWVGKKTGMRGIKARDAVCQDTYLPAASNVCPGGQYVTGFDAGGKAICAP